MYKIIDVSKYNRITDWSKVANEVDGVMIRCAYRGYGSGKIVADPQAGNYAASCRRYGIPFGVYFMSQAINAQEGAEEAAWACNFAKQYGAAVNYPVILDSEDGDGTARVVRADGLSKRVRTDVCLAFLDECARHGMKGGVYASQDWFKQKLVYDEIKHGFIWIARWSLSYMKGINLPKCDMHQYTDKASINGISGRVDVSGTDLNLGEPGKEDPAVEPSYEPSQKHVQLNYQVNHYYMARCNMKIRTKKAVQDVNKVPNGEQIGVLAAGDQIQCKAAGRVGEQIWLYFGLDKKGRERWVCGDTGKTQYMMEV